MSTESSFKPFKILKSWPAYSAFGTFLLYLTGYLALRFHLTVLGISTDLAVLDERYLFAGARFLVYLISCIPILILFAVPVVAISKLISRFVPRLHWKQLTLAPPGRVFFAGIVAGVIAIQLVMRQCFLLNNVLLAHSLPDPAWLRRLVLSEDDALLVLYFGALMLLTALVGFVYWAGSRTAAPARAQARALQVTLAFVLGIMVLLLPVNYGVVIMDYSLPRTNGIGVQPLAAGQAAWLVWEGKSTTTYLQRTGAARTLVTLRSEDVKKIEITGYDPILRDLYAAE